MDVQNDFITGSLSISNCPAQHDGGEVVPVINKLLDQCSFDVVVYTYDWHPHDHISFVENVHDRPLHSTSKVKYLQIYIFITLPVICHFIFAFSLHIIDHLYRSKISTTGYSFYLLSWVNLDNAFILKFFSCVLSRYQQMKPRRQTL